MIVIVICHLSGACDRIVQPVDSCIMSGLQAQAVMAKAHLVQPGDQITTKCGTRE